jgi:hypothetical protein
MTVALLAVLTVEGIVCEIDKAGCSPVQISGLSTKYDHYWSPYDKTGIEAENRLASVVAATSGRTWNPGSLPPAPLRAVGRARAMQRNLNS